MRLSVVGVRLSVVCMRLNVYITPPAIDLDSEIGDSITGYKIRLWSGILTDP
jgi:hypothetical protein